MDNIQERATVEVQVNGENAKNELQSLEKYAVSLKDRIAEAYNAGDTKKMKQLEKELQKTNSQLRTMRTNAVNIDEVMKNLSTAGPKDLQKTLNAINKELASGRIKRGSKEWGEYQAKLKMVKAELAKIKAEGVEAEGFLSRMNNKLSKWGGMLASAAALTGVSLAFAKMRKDADDKEENADNLKALTGLNDQSVAWLTKQAETLSTTMEKNGLRVKQSSKDILDAYMKVGSEKPELLSNKEALNATTIEAMRLAAAAKTDLAPAVQALTLSLNQYNKGAEYAVEFTNILAAGSQAGSANVMNQAAALKNCGVAAYSANIPMQETAGTIQTLAKFGIKDEMAGTGLKKFFLTLQTGSDDTNPKIVGLEKALENLNKKQLSAAQIKKQFGEEGYNVASILIRETALVKYFTKAVTGTNVAVEQATINSDNRAAKRAQMINQLREAGIELMNRLNPSINILGTYFTNMVKALPVIIDFLQKYGRVIVYATTVVLAYIAAEKLQHFWVTKVKTATGEYIVVQKLKQFWDKAVAASTWLYIAATSALTGKTNQAKLAMKAFYLIIKSNPFAAIATVVVAVAGAFYLMTKRLSEAQRAQELLNKVQGDAQSQISAERTEVETLLKIAQDENKTKGERLKAIKRLNEISPEYLGNLSLEKINTDEARKSVDKYVESILLLAKTESAKNRLTDTESELDGLKRKQVKYLEERNTFIGAMKALPKNLGYLFSAGVAENTAEAFTNDIHELEGQRDQLIKIIEDNTRKALEKNDISRTIEVVDNEIKTAQTRLSKLLGMTDFEKEKLDYDYDQVVKDVKSKIKLLQEEKKKMSSESVTPPDTPLDDKAIKEATKKLEADFAKVKAEQTALYVTGKMNKQEFDAFVADSERKLLDSKMKLYSKESKEYNDLLQQKLQMQVKQNQACEKEDIQSIDDRIKKEKRLLLDAYVDRDIDKKAFDEGNLQLDYDALKAKRDLYVEGSQEYNQYQAQLDDLCYRDKLKRQQEYEEKIKELRLKYAKKTVKELEKEELEGLENLYKKGKIKKEEYERFKKGIEDKYAAMKLAKVPGESGFSEESTSQLREAQIKARLKIEERKKKEKKQNPEDDKENIWDALFRDPKEYHDETIKQINELESTAVITHKVALEAKKQADIEYHKSMVDVASAAYAQVASVMSSTSAYMDACQDAETAKIEKKYEKEIAAAGKNSAKVAKLEDAKEKEIAKVKSKYNKRKTAMQIAQALAETAIGAMSAYNAGWEAGFPAGPILAPLFAGIAIANGLLQVATIKKQAAAQEAGYYQGGFTGPGVWNEEKGTVHADEFVANRYAVRNKELLPVLRLIDNAQKNNTVGSLTAADVTTVLSGGKTSAPAPLSSGSSVNDGTEAALLISVMSHNATVMEKLNKRLDEPFHTINTVDGPDGMKQALDKYESLQRNKSRG